MITNNNLKDNRYKDLNNLKEVIHILADENNGMFQSYIRDLIIAIQNNQINIDEIENEFIIPIYVQATRPNLVQKMVINDTFTLSQPIIITKNEYQLLLSQDHTFLDNIRKQIITILKKDYQKYYYILLNDILLPLNENYQLSYPYEFITIVDNQKVIEQIVSDILYSKVDVKMKQFQYTFLQQLSLKEKEFISQYLLNEVTTEKTSQQGAGEHFYNLEIYPYELDYASIYFLNPDLFYLLINRKQIGVRFYFKPEEITLDIRTELRINTILIEPIEKVTFLEDLTVQDLTTLLNKINSNNDLYDFVTDIIKYK